MFKTKRDLKDNVERFKTRLVAKGFTQREDIDYKEFLSTFMKDSFRIIMTLVVSIKEIHLWSKASILSMVFEV